MALVKTVDLTGTALDWAVAKCENVNITRDENGLCFDHYYPSSDWTHGGPIIKRENIGISPPTSRVHRYGGPHAGWGPSNYWSATTWHAGVNGRRNIGWHETEPLVAAMRCYVASKLGEEVDVPDELKPAPKEAP